MSHIFVSYKHGDFGDSDFLEQLENRAQSAGIVVWRDTGIEAGDNWEIAIDTAINDCFALVLLMTENVTDSQYVTYEWTRALTLGKSVIPIRLSDNSTLHPRLEKTQYIDFTSTSEQLWKLLFARLHALHIAFDENLKKEQELSQAESRRIYTVLRDLYAVRISKVTAEDILTELRSQHYLSLADFARLIDLSRQNQTSSEES